MKTLRKVVCGLVVAGLLAVGGAAWGQGRVFAWGRNDFGQLGNGTLTNSDVPAPMMNLSGVVGVAGGYRHSLAVKNDGTVWSCGSNNYGQLGDGTLTNSAVPVQVKGLSGVVSVAAGTYHSLALKNDGTVWAWGFNNWGQLGIGTKANASLPVQVHNLDGVVSVAAGTYHSLALKNDGTVWQFGECFYEHVKWLPVQVKNLSRVVAVADGGGHCLALKSDGTIWAWGINDFGELGNGTQGSTNTPVQVKTLYGGAFSGAVAVAAGGDRSVAVKKDGTVWEWGYYDSWIDPEFHIHVDYFDILPLQVPDSSGAFLSGMVAVAAGDRVDLALKNDGTVWHFWRWEWSSGPVVGLAQIAAVSAGYSHLLAGEGPLVDPSPSTLALTAATGQTGKEAMVCATLEDAATGGKLAGKRIFLQIDGADTGMATTDTFGVARCIFSVSGGMTLGSHAISVNFTGDPYNAPSSASNILTIAKGADLLLEAAACPQGKTASLRATLTDTVTGAKLEGRTVAFSFEGAEIGTATTDANGVATYPFLVPEHATIGKRPIAASFAGDGVYGPTSADNILKVSERNAILRLTTATGWAGEEVTLEARLIPTLGNWGLEGRTVLFKIDGTDVGTAATDATGLAKIIFLVPEDAALGKHATAAHFDGDAYYSAASASSTLTISKRKVSLSFPSAVGYPGQNISIFATLTTREGVAMGGRTINFALDGSAIGSATTDAAGRAKLSYTVPADESLGVHSLTAGFAGDGNYEAITKSATLTVNKIPVKLPVFGAIGYAGRPVTLLAKLLDAFNLPMAGATLSYSMGGVVLGTAVTDATGQAKFSYAIPAGTAAGIYPFTVSYAGDATHLSRSNTGNLTVK